MVILLYLVFIVVTAYAQDLPIVNTTQGRIQGTKAPDGDYFVFYGIHYAGPVSGINRFKAAPPPPIYPEVFQADNDDVICAQPTSRGIIGVEDCLTLNIYTPNITASQPVLVWIMGEEYSTTDPTPRSFKNFIDENIVVVKINYRLSIFGFLCLRVEEAPGNAGLKDIVQGLKWIKQNIAQFGGNPDNVVLFGHGSGGAMVDLITMIPSARNLVHKAIVQSGSALSPTAVAYDPIGYAQMFAKKLGYFYESKEKLADALIKTDINLFANKLNDFELLNNTALFAPCIENPHNSNSILTAAPIDILKSGNYSEIPYIAGFTDKEGTIRTSQAINDQWLNKMDERFEDFLQVDLDIKPQTNKTIVAESIRQFYFKKNSINMNVFENYTDYHGDTMIAVSIVRGVRERAKTSKAEVSLYHFKYRGTYNSDWIFPQIPLTGVRHGGVLNYLLNYDLKYGDMNVMKSLMMRYSMFIWNGTTNSPKIVEWRPVSDTVFYLCYSGGEVSPNVTVTSESGMADPMEETVAFWDDLYSKYYKAPHVPSSAAKLSTLTIFLVLCQLLTMFI